MDEQIINEEEVFATEEAEEEVAEEVKEKPVSNKKDKSQDLGTNMDDLGSQIFGGEPL